MKPEHVINEIEKYLDFKASGQEALMTFKIKVKLLIRQYREGQQ